MDTVETTINTTVSFRLEGVIIMCVDNYQNQMFIRKAQDEANETEHQRGEHHGYSGKKKDRYSKKPFFPQKQLRSETKNKQSMSPEEITRRTRINSENFPPLVMDEKLKELEQESKVEEPQGGNRFFLEIKVNLG